LADAKNIRIPVVAICDTNNHTADCDVVIIGNNKSNKSMGLFFAIFIGVIFYGFPAALTIYWLIQNIFTLSYQARLSKVQS